MKGNDMEITISLGDTYRINAGKETFEVEVTALNTRNVTFSAKGETVKNPETPRVMPILVFVNWLEGLQQGVQVLPSKEKTL